MAWTVEFTRAAAKARDRLPQVIRERILRAVVELADNPYGSANVKALQARAGYRLRVGDYRVLYTLESQRLVIEVIRIAHRSDAY